MIKWIAFLSDGTQAIEGEGLWQEIPGEKLPWRRLCEYLEKENLYITNMVILGKDNKNLSFPTSFRKNKEPLFYSIQYEIELDNIMGGQTSKTIMHFAAHLDNHICHMFIDTNTGEMTTRIDSDFVPMCPSPSRLTSKDIHNPY